jgi:hypothetical protein
VKDSFVRSQEVEYSREGLWFGFEAWRSIIGERFKAAGGKGLQTRITMYWAEGGWATRRMSPEIRAFAGQEHLEPSTMESTVYNADILDATLEVQVQGVFWGQPRVKMRISGDVRQDVVGLEVLLREEAETQMREERERAEEEAWKLHAAFEAKRLALNPAAAAVAAAPAAGRKTPWYRSTWLWGTSVVAGIGVLVGVVNLLVNLARG